MTTLSFFQKGKQEWVWVSLTVPSGFSDREVYRPQAMKNDGWTVEESKGPVSFAGGVYPLENLRHICSSCCKDGLRVDEDNANTKVTFFCMKCAKECDITEQV